jgi:hypothetical protein
MEACASSHYWGRELSRIGHEVRLNPPAYVKPFVKRQKNDAADAEAICEASQRPTMRFVQIKSEAAQAAAVVFRARDLLVSQRTQIINALRGHLADEWPLIKAGHMSAPDYAPSSPKDSSCTEGGVHTCPNLSLCLITDKAGRHGHPGRLPPRPQSARGGGAALGRNRPRHWALACPQSQGR